MKINWDVTEKSTQATGVVIDLPTYDNDTRETVYMFDGDGNEVGNVRVGSILHWLLIKNGGKVVRK